MAGDEPEEYADRGRERADAAELQDQHVRHAEELAQRRDREAGED